MKSFKNPVVVTQQVQATPEEVWAALTDLDQMHGWYFDNIPEFKPIKGFKTQFPVQSGDKIFTHLWEITEAIPTKKISYTWSFKEYSGEGGVIFEISKLNNKTLVSLTNYVTKPFPDNIVEFTRESCVGGWKYFINQKLKEYLENK